MFYNLTSYYIFCPFSHPQILFPNNINRTTHFIHTVHIQQSENKNSNTTTYDMITENSSRFFFSILFSLGHIPLGK